MSRQMLPVYCFMFWLLIIPNHCILEKIKYVTLERPVVQYYNKKYLPYFKVTARRHTRNDPNYYVSSQFDISLPLDNNMTANFYFYEFSTNTYKKTLIEMHLKFCDLLRDKFLGSLLSKGSLTKCPLPPGNYYVVNSTLSINNIPNFFTLNKGRIKANLVYSCTGETISSGYIDLEIKERYVRAKQE